jgi:hyperosmotically inducible protein
MQKITLMNSFLAIALLSGGSIAAHAAGQAAGQIEAPAALQVTPSEPAAAATTDLSAAAEGGKVSDAEITASAKAALKADAQSAAMPVRINTSEGVVALTGSVTSAQAGDRVLQIVASVSGVREIKNELKVKTSS